MKGSVGVGTGGDVIGGLRRWVGVRGANGNGVLNANRSAVLVLGRLLGLELHFEQFDFLLLLHQSELGCSR